jgi:predicted metal-dependent phosphoesterase TrpH
MIDLHTHTTASDGRCAPPELVARAFRAGVSVLAVTDHDTTAGCAPAAAACRDLGIEFVAGIEMTAVADETDVHVLGYFIDAQSPSLATFLAEQRQRRVVRVNRMIEKLADLGLPLEADAVLRPAASAAGASIGRPAIARALVAAGYVANTNQAFELWLSRGQPAFVAREGARPETVIARIHAAGGIASLAHPGLLGHDEWIHGLVDAGLDALEAHHSDHDEAATRRYREMAAALGVAVSGGSDYHADESHGAPNPGSVSLPPHDYDQLKRRAASRATASGSRVSS